MAKKAAEAVEEVMVQEEAQVEEKVIEPYSAEDLVELPPLFYDKDKYSASVSVIVNGKAWLIPRGVSGIKVPRVVKEILDQSAYQEQMAGAYMRLQEGVKNLGEF